ncbi:MAG: hydrogenase nickel incorporation protein HypB [Thermoplasmata archaeon]|nr:hydrogenase nickel incorporation protein HypB [Thermoplasmata archaeon]
MHKVVDVEMGADLLEANNRIASDNHSLLRSHGIISFDFIGSIGSGKTMLIEAIVDILRERNIRAGVICGDVAGDDDFKRVSKHDVPVRNLNTGKECHLDAHLVDHCLDKFDLESLDVMFIENVGNLVCPGDFWLGTDKRVAVVSVTEGDDMIRKHPVIFGLADIIVINKIGLAEAIEVDPQVLVSDAARIAPGKPVILTDAKKGTGVEDLIATMGL